MAERDVRDVLIVGGSFAGLTAAATLVRQLHTAVVFDSGSYRNARSSHMHVMPAWDHQPPEKFREAARTDLKKYGTIQFQPSEIKTVRKDDSGLFEATDESGQQWWGRKVILASGVDEVYPDIPGYEECWARKIYHCLFCHGYEQRGASSAGVLAVGLVGASKPAMHMSRMASRLAKTVTVYTHGNKTLGDELRAAFPDPDQFHVDDRPISRLALSSDSDEYISISFENGKSEAREAFLAHAPNTRAKGPFAAQLGLELTPSGDYVVQPPFNMTSMDGVFAAGDCSSPFKVSTNAVASGSMTGAGVSAKLQEEQMFAKPAS